MNIIPMSQKEIDRYDIIARLLRREINGTQASRLLKLSTRQVRRLKVLVECGGASALIHASRGKVSNRRIPMAERKRIIQLLHRYYSDFSPAFASEKLAEKHHIIHDPKTIRNIQMSEGLWKPRKKRNGSEHRSWRQRRASFGEMQQYDGCYAFWFEDRGEDCCLLAAIDDATSTVTQAVFAPHEGVVPTFTFWSEYIHRYGKPRSIYLDKFSTYKMNSAVAKDNHDLRTQFQRACQELHIEIIFANSPQAKGRVERLFRTLQDRLIKELRLEGIATVAEANAFLKTYIPKFNKQFAVTATNAANLHVPLAAKEQKTLPSIFSRQEIRTVHNDFTISHHNQWYQLTKGQPATVCKGDRVIVEERLDGSIWIRLRGKYLNAITIPKRPTQTNKKPWILPQQSTTKPAANHPWRRRMHADVLAKQLTN